MAPKFKTICLLGKLSDPAVTAILEAVLELLRARKLHIIAPQGTAELVNAADIEVCPESALCGRADLALIVGGDGTMLNAARLFAPHAVPMVGINAGRLGFLADIPHNQVEQSLNDVLSGKFSEEKRFLLAGRVERGGKTIDTGAALNDVVLQKRDGGRMIEFESLVNGNYVCAHRADGIVVASPTGSTAYALSAGGPILQPVLDAIALVPICPHTLSDRPIVIDGDSEVTLVLKGSALTRGQVVFDGQQTVDLEVGDRLHVKRGSECITLLHPSDHDYFKILRNKLHWGRNHENNIDR